MAKDVIMPALGMAQDTGLIVQWFKAEGDAVSKGEPLLEIETDKATVEIEAPADGVLLHITAFDGEDVPVGNTIAIVAAPGETPPKPAEKPSAVAVPPLVQPDPAPVSSPPGGAGQVLASPVAARMAAEHGLDLAQIKPQGGRVQKSDVQAYLDGHKQPAANGGRVLASPKARRLAGEQGLQLAQIEGSGPQGAVLAADVLAYQPAAAPSIAPAETLPLSSTWRVMAERLSASWSTVPHFYLLREVNATRLIEWRERVKNSADVKITYTDLLVKVVALTLRRYPRVNASWHEGTISLNPDVNVALAVASDDALFVPVVHRADTLGLAEIAARRQEIVARAQAGKLKLDDIQGGTFSISNLGMYGVDAFSAIVNPPQAAILAVGRIADRVVPLNGQPAVQPVMVLSMSFDHRVVDGARGAQFLQTLAEAIEEPLTLLS